MGKSRVGCSVPSGGAQEQAAAAAWWTRTYEGLRGARMFHLVSLSLQISLTDLPGPCLGLCVGVACFVVFVGLVVGFFLLGKFDLNHRLIPVVDRPCLALVRQCRKRKKVSTQRLGLLRGLESSHRGAPLRLPPC